MARFSHVVDAMERERIHRPDGPGRQVSGAPTAGGATTPASRWGGDHLKAKALRWIARLGRHITGFAYRRLRVMEMTEHDRHLDHRYGPAGEPSRAAGAPPPRDRA